MLVLVQDFRRGELMLVDAPAPTPMHNGVVVRNSHSFVSPGTELATIRFAKKSLLGKALARRDLLSKVLKKMKREGVLSALKSAMVRLDEPLPLGYSCAGVVEAVSAEVADFRVGDAVACAGVGYASHSEMVSVPKNLSVKVPDGVSLRDASSVALGAIALQSYRVADLRLGETVVVVGLGTIGKVLMQILRGAGCRAVGYDPDGTCVEQTKALGFDNVSADDDELIAMISTLTGGCGADCVIIAAATTSDRPVELAPKLLRKRGVVVILGDTGLSVPRKPYYEKELQLRFSTSYGPGRYDPQYEVHGRDYPIAFARWTERRNMEAYLRLLADGVVKLEPLIDAEYDVSDALEAYGRLDRGELRSVVFRYKERRETERVIRMGRPLTKRGGKRFGMMGAGGFARSVLLPAFIALGAEPVLLCTKTPAKAATYAKKFGFKEVVSSTEQVIESDVDFVVVATPHSEHPRLLTEALKNGKPTFCEKPLAIDREGMMSVLEAFQKSGTPFMVGFNRRFAPSVRHMRGALREGSPRLISYIINAGRVEKESWIAQPQEGGRIVGEVCHFVDTITYLVGAGIVEVEAFYPPSEGEGSGPCNEVVALLRLSDGSLAQILYSARGSTVAPKERIEIHSAGRTVVLDDFRRTVVYGNGVQKRSFPPDKGHRAEVACFLEMVVGERDATEFVREAFHTTDATLAILDAAVSSTAVRLSPVEIGTDTS